MAVAYVRRDARAAVRAAELTALEHHRPLQVRAAYLLAFIEGKPTPASPISARLYPALS
jgi:hypothetical protein